MATSSHYDNLAPLEPGEDPYKPFQRCKSANDAATHHVSPLTKSSNKNELAASVEVGIIHVCTVCLSFLYRLLIVTILLVIVFN